MDPGTIRAGIDYISTNTLGMGKPAARIGDMHVCPMVTPGTPPIPHVGGPVTGPGCPTVMIGGMPAATMGDMCTCVGPPDSIILGSTGVFIGGKPAARMGDMCAHGGSIVVGIPTVMIGEVSPGGVSPVAVAVSALASVIQKVLLKEERGAVDGIRIQTAAMTAAAAMGTAFVHNACNCADCST